MRLVEYGIELVCLDRSPGGIERCARVLSEAGVRDIKHTPNLPTKDFVGTIRGTSERQIDLIAQALAMGRNREFSSISLKFKRSLRP